MINGETSHWMRQSARRERPALDGDTVADVCVIGAGYTGLWTAYWLTRALPDASVVVVEAEHVGYGASGRNGGWLSGKMIGLPRQLAKGPGGRRAVADLRRAASEAIDEVIGLMARHGVDIDAVHSGYLQIARTPSELARMRASVEADHALGLSEKDVRLLSAEETYERIHVEGVLGAAQSPHCARIDPAKLVLGLADVAERAGVRIVERSPATAVSPGRVVTPNGTVRARHVLRATEGYTPTLPRLKRAVLPMNSSMIVTEPLHERSWDAIGWDACETLSGAQHTYFYAQRTADGRIAIGGRGLPYRFGSRIDDNGRLDSLTIHHLHSVLTDLWPGVDLPIAHAWCGVLAVPRDWTPSVTYNSTTRMGQAGGYAGQGVTAAYLAGHSLADLVAGRDTHYTRLPWTQRRARTWEPEPLRWLGSYATYALYRSADAVEHRTEGDRTSPLAHFADTLSGRH
ncbi:Gamma-glutamylputrescine oxidoreductase [Streptomyces sp. YIM 130001]|uniref:NAD(P)/FAD-dependent oxidoreductase n=1 Tax=Streptomyces sp. YIM 130001 TaxID=2259644 RepID=UPI000E6566C6|nr:FAD-binding oxidoreductase [Streptomyces sp. YIM 130001]RII09339.1 Gamma-glutamylputrescine oxidoreductase [Streptomyces sp. YIM 130001]